MKGTKCTMLTRKTAVYADANETDQCPYADVHTTEGD